MRLTTRRLRKAERLFARIKAFYGPSNWHDWTPRLVCFHDPGDHYGYYARRVWLNFAQCQSWREAIQTLIHEYAHHLQDPRRTDSRQCDREADELAAKDWRRFR